MIRRCAREAHLHGGIDDCQDTAAAAFALALPAHAQGYPSRPIKIIDAAAPGGGSDMQSRLLAERLQAKLGQPVIVENRPGAAGLIAAPPPRPATTLLPKLVLEPTDAP